MNDIDRPLQRPNPELESAFVFTSKRQARRYVRNVVASMIANELAVYGSTSEGWFVGDCHEPRTRELIKEAALALKAELLR